jgi:hypothetical protein
MNDQIRLQYRRWWACQRCGGMGGMVLLREEPESEVDFFCLNGHANKVFVGADEPRANDGVNAFTCDADDQYSEYWHLPAVVRRRPRGVDGGGESSPDTGETREGDLRASRLTESVRRA